MVEAMWSVEFVTNQATGGSGIVVLETGRVMGGDSSYLYTGSYEFDRGILRAKIKVRKYAPGNQSVFGNLKEFNLTVEGEPGHDQWELSGVMDESAENQIAIRLKRQDELP